MKKSLLQMPLALLGLLFALSGSAQAQNVVNVADYGAIPGDAVSDQAAFEQATQVLRKGLVDSGGDWQLLIPASAGEYIVGHQAATAGQYLVGASPISLDLDGISYGTVHIQGTGANIKYADGLYFGAFQPGTTSPNPGITTNYAYAATGGNFIQLRKCHNVTITGMTVNGNNEKFRVGGEFGDTGIQLDHDGIFVNNSTDITVEGAHFSHFGRDGMQVYNETTVDKFDDPNHSDNIVLRNTVFDYNGRQGLSWTGGVGLLAQNCQFNNSGQSINTFNSQVSSRFGSSPQAGVDIEPQGGFYARRLRFENCQVLNNYGRGVLSDAEGVFIEKAKDVAFDKCTIWHTSSGGPAVWTVRPNFTFADCNIYGRIMACYSATQDPANATKFLNCNIEDKPYLGQPVNTSGYNFLLGVYRRCERALFEGCHITANVLALSDIDLYGAPAPAWAQFNNCDFTFNYGAQPGGYTRLTGVAFGGNNTFNGQNINPAVRGYRHSLGSGSFGRGLNTLNTGLGITNIIENANTLHLTNNATLVLDNNSYLLQYGDPQTIITIDEGSTMIVRRGSMFRTTSGARIVLNGRLVIEDGAYICMDEYTDFVYGPNSELYIDRNAIIGQNLQIIPLDPIWGLVNSNHYFQTCVKGGKVDPHISPAFCPQTALSVEINKVYDRTRGALLGASATGGNGVYTYAWYFNYNPEGKVGYEPANLGNVDFIPYPLGVAWVRVDVTSGTQQASAFWRGEDFLAVQGPFNVYPNPADNYLEVNLKGQGQPLDRNLSTKAGAAVKRSGAEETVKLYDKYGQQKRSSSVVNGRLRLDTSSLPEGIYYLKSSGGKVVSKQIVIKH